MHNQISESDWKLLRRLQPIALDRFCEAVLSEVARLASGSAKDNHARYLKLFKLIQERDEELGEAFNDVKRSIAYLKLAHMRSLGLITDEEFADFSEETRGAVALFQGR